MLATDTRKRSLKIQVVPTKVSQSTMEDPPYSPAESTTSFISSFSGIAGKSASELGSLLRGAYKSLKEKEKNLMMAAEFGNSLLERNETLKSDYNELLQKMSSEDMVRRFSIKSMDDDDDMQLVPCNKNTYEMIIDSLEKLNLEMQNTLEETQEEAALTNQASLQKQRKLEQEIVILKGNLEIAADKVQELEEENRCRARQLETKRHLEQRQLGDLKLLEELTVQMEALFHENQQLQKSKKSVEDKLTRSLHDLELLKHDFENFELTQQNYDDLQEAFDRQAAHIKELNDSLEEHRNMVSQSRTPSLSGHQSLSSKQSLMGEIENACQDFTMERMISSASCSSILEETASRLLKFAGSCDLFEPDANYKYAECDIYPKLIQQQVVNKPKRRGLLGLLQLQIRYLFSSLFQWCRFAIVLTAAVLINLWKGPRLLMQK